MAEEGIQEYLNSIHIFENNNDYDTAVENGEVSTNDISLIRDTSLYGEADGIEIMNDGVDPDVLVYENLLYGTPIKNAEGEFPFKNTKAVVGVIGSSSSATTKVLDLNKNWKQYKYIVIMCGDTSNSEINFVIIPTKRIFTREKIYEDYITSSGATVYIRGAEVSRRCGLNRWVGLTCFNTSNESPIANPGMQIKIRASAGCVVYSLYGVNELG